MESAFAWATKFVGEPTKRYKLEDIVISGEVLWVTVSETVTIRRFGIPIRSKCRAYWKVTKDGEFLKCQSLRMGQESEIEELLPDAFAAGLELFLTVEKFIKAR